MIGDFEVRIHQVVHRQHERDPELTKNAGPLRQPPGGVGVEPEMQMHQIQCGPVAGDPFAFEHDRRPPLARQRIRHGGGGVGQPSDSQVARGGQVPDVGMPGRNGRHPDGVLVRHAGSPRLSRPSN